MCQKIIMTSRLKRKDRNEMTTSKYSIYEDLGYTIHKYISCIYSTNI